MPTWYHYRFPTQGDTYCFTIESRNLRPNDGQPRSQGPLLLGPSRRGPWERGWTMATCQRNISQHCWAQHVAMCCAMLGVVGSNLTIFKLEPTTPNVSQHIATRWPNARNMLRPTMLWYVALACCERKSLIISRSILQHYYFFHYANLIWSNKKHSRMTIPNYKLLFLVVRTLFLFSFWFLT